MVKIIHQKEMNHLTHSKLKSGIKKKFGSGINEEGIILVSICVGLLFLLTVLLCLQIRRDNEELGPPNEIANQALRAINNAQNRRIRPAEQIPEVLAIPRNIPIRVIPDPEQIPIAQVQEVFTDVTNQAYQTANSVPTEQIPIAQQIITSLFNRLARNPIVIDAVERFNSGNLSVSSRDISRASSNLSELASHVSSILSSNSSRSLSSVESEISNVENEITNV